MTHFLRSCHDAIFVGVTTAVVNNPSLNCHLEGVEGYGGDALEGQPKPIVIDHRLRWTFENEGCNMLKLTEERKGKAPFILTASSSAKVFDEKKKYLESKSGKIITVPLSKDGNVSEEWIGEIF